MWIYHKGIKIDVDISYDCDDGQWTASTITPEGHMAAGSGGSLEIAMHSICQALRELEESRRGLDELTRLSQELGLYDD